jgi:hypothetical protein
VKTQVLFQRYVATQSFAHVIQAQLSWATIVSKEAGSAYDNEKWAIFPILSSLMGDITVLEKFRMNKTITNSAEAWEKISELRTAQEADDQCFTLLM